MPYSAAFFFETRMAFDQQQKSFCSSDVFYHSKLSTEYGDDICVLVYVRVQRTFIVLYFSYLSSPTPTFIVNVFVFVKLTIFFWGETDQWKNLSNNFFNIPDEVSSQL